SFAAGSNTSCAVLQGSSRFNRSGIGPAVLNRGAFDRLIERARLLPDASARCGDAVASFGHELPADGDLLVPAFGEAVALEPGHKLVERCACAPHAEARRFRADGTPRLLAAEQESKSKKLEVR